MIDDDNNGNENNGNENNGNENNGHEDNENTAEAAATTAEDQDTSSFILDFLSFETGHLVDNHQSSSGGGTITINSRMNNNSNVTYNSNSGRRTTNPSSVPTTNMQGVLWKRRDVFKNRWRPRWFVLHRDRRILTYYLLTNNNTQNNRRERQQQQQQQVTDNGGNNTLNRRRTNDENDDVDDDAIGSGGGGNNNRRRTFSETSNVSHVSESTLDYDVIPRGTIVLQDTATVARNDILSRPEQNMFVFTITDNNNGQDGGTLSSTMKCHLAARTNESRDQWIEQIRDLIFINNSTRSSSRSTTNNSHQNQTQPRRRSRREMIQSPAAHVPSSPIGLSSIVMDGSQPSESPVAQQDVDDAFDHHHVTSTTPSTTTASWTSIPCPDSMSNVPPSLVEEIDATLQEYLPYVDDLHHPYWQLKYDNNNKTGIHCSIHKHRPAMIRSVCRSTNHHPVEYLQSLWDVRTHHEYETNVDRTQVLKTYNPYTMLVHQSYHAVWPTSPRDFAVVAHWRLLERRTKKTAAVTQNTDNDANRNDQNNINRELALCLISFSCREADELAPVNDWSRVRGSLVIGFNFWTLQDGGCNHTRIISYDLKGQIPIQITQTILEQQSTYPHVLDMYLATKKKDPAYHVFDHQLDYQCIVDDLKRVTSTSSSKAGTHRMSNQMKRSSDSVIASQTNNPSAMSHDPMPEQPSILHDVVHLLSPLVVLKVSMLVLSPTVALLLFPLYVLLAVRRLFGCHLTSLLRELSPPTTYNMNIGATCCHCHFTVDLKGVLRFLSNEKEAKEELRQSMSPHEPQSADVLVQHIVIRALAVTMNKMPNLISRRVPLFSGRKFYSIVIAVHDKKQRRQQGQYVGTTDNMTLIRNADHYSVQELANILHHEGPQNTNYPRSFLGTMVDSIFGPACHLWTSPDSTHSQIDMDVMVDSCPITVCISGIRLTTKNSSSSNGNNSNVQSQSPSLSVSATIQSSDVELCRRFVEEIQKLIQFPEMLED